MRATFALSAQHGIYAACFDWNVPTAPVLAKELRVDAPRQVLRGAGRLAGATGLGSSVLRGGGLGSGGACGAL